MKQKVKWLILSAMLLNSLWIFNVKAQDADSALSDETANYSSLDSGELKVSAISCEAELRQMGISAFYAASYCQDLHQTDMSLSQMNQIKKCIQIYHKAGETLNDATVSCNSGMKINRALRPYFSKCLNILKAVGFDVTGAGIYCSENKLLANFENRFEGCIRTLMVDGLNKELAVLNCHDEEDLKINADYRKSFCIKELNHLGLSKEYSNVLCKNSEKLNTVYNFSNHFVKCVNVLKQNNLDTESAVQLCTIEKKDLVQTQNSILYLSNTSRFVQCLKHLDEIKLDSSLAIVACHSPDTLESSVHKHFNQCVITKQANGKDTHLAVVECSHLDILNNYNLW